MSKPKIPNQRKANLQHKKRVEKYALLIQQVYDNVAKEAAHYAVLTGADTDKKFSFSDYPLTKEAIKKLQSRLMSEIKGIIMTGASEEWKESNLVQDLVVKKVLTAYTGTSKIGDEYSRYFETNPDSLKAFQERKDRGMNLSTRVWDLSEQYKQELEESITAAIALGTSAVELAAQVKKYLKEPDKRFRRIKEKMEDGTIKWHLSKNAKAYHPGQGVYRSSARNAQRLARTEINMSYRTAEQERWKQFDFVVGYEIKTTQNGHHVEDMCDDLSGKYPKTFKFTGWHPQCYDELSEVLTQNGWKRFKDVNNEDSILSLNPETRELEWVSIVDKQCFEHSGVMAHFYNKSLDCLVTPEHRMVYLNKTDGKIKYCQAKDYTQGKGAFYRGAEYIGADIDSFEIEGHRICFDDFCEFMGYYLSDGSLQHGTGVCISQQENQPAFQPILDVCHRMGYNPKVSNPNVCIYNSALNRYLSQFGKCTDKFIPSEIKTASKRQIRIFLNAFLKCDGYSRKPKSFVGNHGNKFVSDKEERLYFTTSERLSADLSELILKIGHRPSFTIQQPQTTKKKDGRIIKGNHICYRISECYSSTSTVFKKEIVSYSGKVYDLTLERNHIMYIRRNGKCFWGSNCMCYCIPILKTEEEFWADDDVKSVNEVTDMPQGFKDWIRDNSDRIEAAEKRGNLPYFIRDNKDDVENILNRKSYDKEQEIMQMGSERKFVSAKSVNEATDIATLLGIKKVDFGDATIDEINMALEVLHKASSQMDFELDYFFLAQDIHKQSKSFTKPVGGYYDDDHKTMAIDLTTFRKSHFTPIVSYKDKIVSLRNNIANLERQIEQSEARLGRSKSMDKMMKADIKMFRSRIDDIEIKIRSFEKLIASGNDALPFTVASSFEDVKKQVQAEIWHEIGHYVDHKTGRQRFKEGNFISEYCKDMRGEEFAEWFSFYKMNGKKGVPADLLKIFKSVELNTNDQPHYGAAMKLGGNEKSLSNRMAVKDGRVEDFFDIDNKDRNRLVSTIHEINKKTKIFPQSFDITISDDLYDGTLMAWREGELRISNAIYRMDDKTTFCPARDIMSAFNKLKRKEQLTFTEEYSIESLFHESVHSRYLSGKFEANPLSDIMMEGCTQLYARERYTKILKHFKASAHHYDEIRINGYGYRDIVDILRPYFTKDGKLQIGELINIAIGEEDGIKKLSRMFKELNVSSRERKRIMHILNNAINDHD